jgi:NADH-quinone oxidoreductase subunit L
MNFPIHIFLVIPFIGLIISFLIPSKKEILISRLAFYTSGITLLVFIGFIITWFIHGHPSINIAEVALYRTYGYEFVVDLYFDKISAVYLMVGGMLTFLITIYSRYYLHREKGYKRFFSTILLFYLGYNTTVLSGNFETLFIGWELLGISSFLLIAFYRERYLPVRNAVKVFTIYRIGDVGILLAMWASHHLWHENITFAKLYNYNLVHEHLQNHSLTGVIISLGLLVAAAAKSAQLPFSSWLPRAMEGPTSSSAIFYGSLSVHFGVFLLLRTFPFWEQQTSVRILIGLLGFSTAIVTTLIARVQSSIKSQIAYASIGQIGIIFIEVAAGFETLALIHFAGNAFLRTYQLLVSPSVVSYLIKEQFYNFVPRHRQIEDRLPNKIEYSLYILSMKEFNLDHIMNVWIFYPMKIVGKKLNFITQKNVFYFFMPVYILGMILLHWEDLIPKTIHNILPTTFSFIGLLMVLKSFSERKSPQLSWLLLVMNHFWVALAISHNEHFNAEHISLYLSGVVTCGILGFYALSRLKRLEPKYFDLNKYYGHAYEYPLLAFVFLLASLGLMGFPISPTFIGEDLIFSHIRDDQFFLAFFNSLAFIMGGIAIIRMYARLFLGPHIKTYHETPYQSS